MEIGYNKTFIHLRLILPDPSLSVVLPEMEILKYECPLLAVYFSPSPQTEVNPLLSELRRYDCSKVEKTTKRSKHLSSHTVLSTSGEKFYEWHKVKTNAN